MEQCGIKMRIEFHNRWKRNEVDLKFGNINLAFTLFKIQYHQEFQEKVLCITLCNFEMWIYKQ